MQTRTITSKTYGYAEKFYLAGEKHKHLYKNDSGRIYIWGEGALGGKGEGLLFLDRENKNFKYHIPDVNLIVCNDRFSILSHPINALIEIKTIEDAAFHETLEIMQRLGLDFVAGFRSSAGIEDQAGHSAAGIFSSRLSFLGEDFEMRAKEAILHVLNSNYSPQARAYYKKRGFHQIPPMSMIIQPLIGEFASDNPSRFMPQFSGIINTGSPDKIKVATTIGFGASAVGPQGVGVTHFFNSKLKCLERKGYLPNFYFYLNTNGNDLRPSIFTNVSSTYSSFQESLEKLSPDLQKKLGNIGSGLQKIIRNPVDIEWAQTSASPFLIQARPTKAKMAFIPKPETKSENTILETTKIIGQGNKTFNTILFLNIEDKVVPKKFSQEAMEKLDEKYPGSLFIMLTPIPPASSTNMKEIFTYNLWANAAAAVIIDTKKHLYEGTGLQHLALNCIEEDKLLLHTTDITFMKKMTRNASLVEDVPSKNAREGTIKVYQLPFPLHITADDENGWGLIYKT